MGSFPSTLGWVLAGGDSRRMGGGAKGLLPLAGKPMVHHAVARLEGDVVYAMLNVNGDPAPYAALGLPCCADDEAGLGPVGGVLTGLRVAAEARLTQIMTVPCDAPFMPEDVVARLHEGDPGAPAVAVSPDGWHPTVARWPVPFAFALRQWVETDSRRSLRDALVMLGAYAVAFPDGSAFANVNTPEDLQAANLRATKTPEREAL